MQTILIFALFVAALSYLGWRVYTRFSAKKAGCGKGCGCSPESKPAVRRVAPEPVVH